ncbi:MAG: GNAT family N-acetyltransferase [Treponema sp.]|jgi:ribosomal protein S18 acetylase RimI-like enzyme|nr:GNAT family N-acetyltransferase [Treponema sp.]
MYEVFEDVVGRTTEENIKNIEIVHFGIHPEYRGKHLGTKLMDYIKRKNKTMILSTDDHGIGFYKKYEKRRYNIYALLNFYLTLIDRLYILKIGGSISFLSICKKKKLKYI